MEIISTTKDIFTQAGAQDICTTGEASMPKNSDAADRASHRPEPVLSAPLR
jgi:hypothetical protein